MAKLKQQNGTSHVNAAVSCKSLHHKAHEHHKVNSKCGDLIFATCLQGWMSKPVRATVKDHRLSVPQRVIINIVVWVCKNVEDTSVFANALPV
jgi:hypothetical protein